MDAHTLLLEVVRADDVAAARAALDRAGVRYEAGLLAGQPPRVLFSVPDGELDRARAALSERFPSTRIDRADPGPVAPVASSGPSLRPGAVAFTAAPRPGDARAPDRARSRPVGVEPVEDAASETSVEPPTPFPTRAVAIVGAIIAVHAALLVFGRDVVDALGLVKGRTFEQPYRLLTAMFVHSGPSHVLSNGVALLAFGVPMLQELGRLAAAVVYVAAGLGGAWAGLSFLPDGAMLIGSSGAVAGVFGAWVVVRLLRESRETIAWRARIRVIGVALLVLPAFLNPSTPTGGAISVEAHLGGMATGMGIGALLTRLLLKRDG